MYWPVDRSLERMASMRVAIKKRARRTGLWAQGPRCLDTPCEPLSLIFSLSARFPESYRGVAAALVSSSSNQRSSICVVCEHGTEACLETLTRSGNRLDMRDAVLS